MNKYNINGPDWARGLIAATRRLNNLYGKKEMKKVSRPYFELKVIKIKKPKYQSREVIKFMGKKYEVFIKDGKVSIRRHKHQRQEDNWVNGENIDKIKFPVPCSYVDDGEKHIGMLNKYVNWYRLYYIEKQSDDNFVDDCTSLRNLINDYDIHILKGKVIVYEEVNNE